MSKTIEAIRETVGCKIKGLFKKELTEEQKAAARAKEKIFWNNFDNGMNRIARTIWSFFWAGLILNVSVYFWPELPEHIPVIYGLYTQLMKLSEFIIWTGLKGLKSIFEGQYMEFTKEEFWPTVREGWNYFLSWIESI